MKKKNIFNFNHISSEITNAQYNEIKNLYKYYHKLYWCHKEAYKNFKCKRSFTYYNLKFISCFWHNYWWYYVKSNNYWIYYWSWCYNSRFSEKRKIMKVKLK